MNNELKKVTLEVEDTVGFKDVCIKKEQTNFILLISSPSKEAQDKLITLANELECFVIHETYTENA
jgi:hypothetical protein